MIHILAVAFGGAIGAVARFFINIISVKLIGRSWVFTGTVFSNILGCFLAGMGLAWFGSSGSLISAEFVLFVTIGIFGSLTTFSTFALEALHLLNKDSIPQLFTYLFLQIVIAFLSTAAGFGIMNLISGGGI